MSKICEVCGLPEELCVCEEIAREVQTVKVYTVRRRFGKLMTIVEGIDEHDIDIKDLTKTLKAKCACGGTAKKGQIELQGDHKVKVKKVLSDMGFSAKEASRNGNRLIYFKQADTIADFFTALGASSAALSIMTAKVDKEMRNEITRKVNCDTANADKVVATARAQIDAIHEIVGKYGLDSLPEPLKDAALLRIANPEASLADLSVLSYPKVSKSTLAYRLKRLENFRPDPEE